MAFVRIKRIKKRSGNVYLYAYLVENRWRKRPRSGNMGSRQKVKKYLGRAYEYEEKEDSEFLEYNNINDIDAYVVKNSFRCIVADLVCWEVDRHKVRGFKVSADAVRKDGNNCVIKMNEGFLCGYTLGRLARFTAIGDEREDGIELAKSFVDAGIEVPKELFVKIFQKLTKYLEADS